jgi:hypothetical protein
MILLFTFTPPCYQRAFSNDDIFQGGTMKNNSAAQDNDQRALKSIADTAATDLTRAAAAVLDVRDNRNQREPLEDNGFQWGGELQDKFERSYGALRTFYDIAAPMVSSAKVANTLSKKIADICFLEMIDAAYKAAEIADAWRNVAAKLIDRVDSQGVGGKETEELGKRLRLSKKSSKSARPS